MSNFEPWQFNNPYIPGTPIRSHEVNPNFQGISVSLRYIADNMNSFMPKLPPNFNGQVNIPEKPIENTLLGIDENGDVNVFNMSDFALKNEREIKVKDAAEQSINVNGNNHADWFNMQYESPLEVGVITVIVGQATAQTEAGQGVAVGSIIFFNQCTDTQVVFAPIPDVTIRTAGLLRTHSKNSSVALLAISQNEWVLLGDIDLGEQVVE